MSNVSLPTTLLLNQHDIEAFMNSLNKSPPDSFSFWVSWMSYIFAILGSLTNLMSVIVLLKLSSQLSTFVYLTSLSTSDMITSVTVMLMLTIEFLAEARPRTSAAIILRHAEIIFGALAAASRVLSFWISTAVTIDRYILICYPLYGKTFCTLYRARIVSRILFVIALIYSIPLLFEYEVVVVPNVFQTMQVDNEFTALNDTKQSKSGLFVTKGYTDLAKRRVYRWSYLFFNAIFVYIWPTSIIIFSNLQLINALKRRRSRSKDVRQRHFYDSSGKVSRLSSRPPNSKYSLTIMVIAMVIALLLCRSPTIVLWILWSFDLTIKVFFDASSRAIVRRFHSMANLIAIVNAATNFIPFCVFGQLFRIECLRIYCCQKPTSKQMMKEVQLKHGQNNDHAKIYIKVTSDENRSSQFEIDYPRSSTFAHSDSISVTNRSTYDHNSESAL